MKIRTYALELWIDFSVETINIIQASSIASHQSHWSFSSPRMVLFWAWLYDLECNSHFIMKVLRLEEIGFIEFQEHRQSGHRCPEK